MADKIRDIQSRMRNIHGSDQIIAALSYLPFVGWIYPYFFRKEDDMCQFHGKQAMKFNLLSAVIFFILWVLENFPLTAWLFGENAIFNPVTRAISLIAGFAYLGLSLFGAFKAFSEEKWEMPYLQEILDTIRDQLKEKQKQSD